MTFTCLNFFVFHLKNSSPCLKIKSLISCCHFKANLKITVFHFDCKERHEIKVTKQEPVINIQWEYTCFKAGLVSVWALCSYCTKLEEHSSSSIKNKLRKRPRRLRLPYYLCPVYPYSSCDGLKMIIRCSFQFCRHMLTLSAILKMITIYKIKEKHSLDKIPYRWLPCMRLTKYNVHRCIC